MSSDSVTALPNTPPPAPVRLPEVRALVLARGRAVVVSPEGEIDDVSRVEAGGMLDREALLVCHTGFLAQRLGRPRPVRRADLFDATELFAFVRPARFCLPTPGGLAQALDLDPPQDPEDEAVTLTAAAHALLSDLARPDYPHKDQAAAIAATMGRNGWAWAPFVADALGVPPAASTMGGLDIWTHMPEWEERGPQGGHTSDPVAEENALARLSAMLGESRTTRPGQDSYTRAATKAFQPRDNAGEPNVVLAEAGTGTGKTLGYIAPSSLWAEQNGPGTWISTYTKNLQRQLDQELDALYPDPFEKARRAVVRKGRENYLCLLNYEDAARRAANGLDENPIAVCLIARWMSASRDGDMVGGDFPSWLVPNSLVSGAQGLTDRRGECIYGACPHYRKCTIERATRKSRTAHLVIGNHALVMQKCALEQGLASIRGEEDETGSAERRLRFVFDEGHHLFAAADDAFGSTLNAVETAEMRRWIRGAEGRSGRRSRGLPERVSDLSVHDKETEELLQAALDAARHLPLEGWAQRGQEGQPRGTCETFFALVRRHIEARADKASPQFGLECPIHPLTDELKHGAQAFARTLGDLATPLAALSKALRERLDEEAANLDTQTRQRIEAVSRGLDRRALMTIPAWQSMLRALQSETPDHFFDWFALERFQGRVWDIAMHRRYLDPMQAFADAVVKPAHGVLITSATLCDRDPDAPPPDTEQKDATSDTAAQDAAWSAANLRTGVRHLVPGSVTRTSLPSPFDYAAQSRVLIVRDVAQAAPDQIASAYRELFLAAGGGALGIFTAIRRLQTVYDRIATPLEDAGLPLYAQHKDAMDTGTLIDIFKAERDACLLGTDAVRDGVDVPGHALRLIVFDRVPWPRPDLLHKARRSHFGARAYDDMLTRLRLKQAFGRLIRGSGDRGVFVLLDPRMPTRLTTAFPESVTVERVGLADAVAATRAFLSPAPA